jgi:hypothetical protein
MDSKVRGLNELESLLPIFKRPRLEYSKLFKYKLNIDILNLKLHCTSASCERELPWCDEIAAIYCKA